MAASDLSLHPMQQAKDRARVSRKTSILRHLRKENPEMVSQFSRRCGKPAVMERAGQSVCAECAKNLKGVCYPLRRGDEVTLNESERCKWRQRRASEY